MAAISALHRFNLQVFKLRNLIPNVIPVTQAAGKAVFVMQVTKNARTKGPGDVMKSGGPNVSERPCSLVLPKICAMTQHGEAEKTA